MALMIMGLNEY